MRLFLLLFCVSILFADYHRNSSEQRAVGQKTLSYLEFVGNERILDIGCGDGFLTSLLAEKVPFGSVVGIDLSGPMIEFATSHFTMSRLKFRRIDARELDYEGEFDLVTSFTVLHWIPEQLAVLQGIERALCPGGRMVVQMSNRFPSPLQQSLDEITGKEEWKGYFEEFSPSGQCYFSPTEYTDLLRRAGLTLIRIEQFFDPFTFPEKGGFKEFVRQWLSHLRPLPEEQKAVFLDQVIDRYLEILPPNEKGEILFSDQRLRVEAVKPLAIR